jgi:hypothetical protein
MAVLLLNACGTMKIEEFASATPELVLEEYFDGKTRAWGLFEDRNGKVRREFVVDIEGTWDGELLTLDEDFVYSDGETENRLWTLRKTGPDTYAGTTENAVGEATGIRAGNAFNWSYDFNLRVGDGTWKVHFDDWMFLQPDGVLLNKAEITRWGIKLGTVFLSFRKLDESSETT